MWDGAYGLLAAGHCPNDSNYENPVTRAYGGGECCPSWRCGRGAPLDRWRKRLPFGVLQVCSVRRQLNQGVFEKIWINDDEIVGSDLTTAFRRLLADDLEHDLRRERAKTQKPLVRTSHLYLVAEHGPSATEDKQFAPQDLPRRALRSRCTVSLTDYLKRERPNGVLPWERKNLGPSQVRGSNESILVGVVERYSRRSDMLRRFEKLPRQGQAGQSDRVDTAVYRPYRLCHRFGEDTGAQLVRDYMDGIPTTQLIKIYGLSKASVLKLLQEADVTMRRQGLDDLQTAEAVRLYCSGLSLVRVGETIGFGPSSVANALRAAGVPLRGRHDWRS